METPAPYGAPTPIGAPKRKTVVVFGASWAKPGDDLYAESVDLGARLAQRGFAIVNGGYGGTMEGTAKGAAEVAGSERVGVIVSPLFPNRREGGNPFLTRVVDTPTLTARIQAMVELSDYFVIMPGARRSARVSGLRTAARAAMPAATVCCRTDPHTHTPTRADPRQGRSAR